MFEWICLVLLISAIMGLVIITMRRNEDADIIDVAGGVIVVLSVVALVFTGICYLDGIDVKVGLNEGSTYLVKSVTYDDNKITLNLQEINVATNELIGPQFLHVRTIPRVSAAIVVGDIIIYQNGDIGYWVSPF